MPSFSLADKWGGQAIYRVDVLTFW